ncbi:hypothetical protein CTAYLR_007582 [Chrysophaeum taylorii]|uniref:Dynein light chain n=1 Tax=Chrysophaeum taylorii TaxID=2483200 RepID=A0AAD7UGT7_9STRA|nr:hypothetical protein CTAYLR_007582 [Chrysophaeum taylorii]
MTQEKQDAAIVVAQEALLKCDNEQEIAANIKASFEQKYSSTWHCFVGRNFACFVTYEAHSFIYFYIGQVGICLFATE